MKYNFTVTFTAISFPRTRTYLLICTDMCVLLEILMKRYEELIERVGRVGKVRVLRPVWSPLTPPVAYIQTVS